MGKLFSVFSLMLILSACSGSPSEPGGEFRLYEFAIHDHTDEDNFVAKTSDAALIAQLEAQLKLSASNRRLFPIGNIAAGNGGHNAPWRWHYVPNEWELTEVSIELCDGNPTLIEEDLDYWLTTVKTFCPWGGYVLREVAP